MNIEMKEILFKAFDETEHVYTWDYTTREAAIALFDVNDENFAMITERREIADETGAMGDYRDNSYYIWNLYLKSRLQSEPIERLGMRTTKFNTRTEGYDTFGIEDLVNEMSKKPWGSGIKKVESITLGVGKIYISNGDLVLEKKEVKGND